MSLVNSLINQVGRELGRDIYWSARSAVTSASRGERTRELSNIRDTFLSSNEDLYKAVKKKKWSSRMRFVAMVEDISSTIEVVNERVDPAGFGWRDVYAELDAKIDELKLTCSDEEAVELEALDKQNYVGFSITLSRHRNWVQKQIEALKVLPKVPSSLKILLLSPLGLTSRSLKRGVANAIAEVLCAVVWVSLVYFGLKLKFGANEKGGLALVLFGVLFFLIVLAGNFIVLSDLRKSRARVEQQIENMTNYLRTVDGMIG